MPRTFQSVEFLFFFQGAEIIMWVGGNDFVVKVVVLRVIFSLGQLSSWQDL